ncbi:hypothetical protein GCM10011487_36050 [Steroidobacter agaridevorans]|uniref:Uncharacterized protein n=1 Tax=Steroidobacter agaridevorans TaxID=2695856 RepID=A0A829YE58_9GAMM|nr:hypothetical protein [Steroidobacter agaridevorans]GFE81605.1 hypothetical protein GCM10011487_36050 [Steroidobacter agaridevorans]GFE90349.1 hypothetical protein GCM10011488_53030 [Steroidobacter agaridevorans]
MSTKRFTLSLLLMFASVAVFAAEEQGTLSKEATAAGPAVDTSKTTNVSADQAPPAAEPSTSSERAGGPRAVVRNDRLDLETTTVTGNRELPKVMYVVPWKKSDLGDLPAQPFNTLLDEALTPVDRDVFRREVTYYGAINGGADAPPSQPPSTEK